MDEFAPVRITKMAVWIATLAIKAQTVKEAVDKLKLMFQKDPDAMFQSDVMIKFEILIDKIESMELNVINEIKSEKYRELVADIKSSREKVESLVSSYDGEFLATRLDDFVKFFDEKNIEFNLVNLLDASVPGGGNFLKSFVANTKIVHLNMNDQNIKTSPVNMLYELFLFVLHKIIEANNLHRFAVGLRNKLRGIESCSDFAYIDHRKTSALNSLKSVTKQAYEELSVDHHIYHSPLNYEKGSSSKKLFIHTEAIKVSRHGCVVTGTRFVRRNKVIYMQLQSAKLLPYGVVDQSTIEWEPLPESESHVEFRNFATCFGSLCAKSVVTGVKFEHAKVKVPVKAAFFTKIDSATVMVLRIYGRRFNFFTGTLESQEVSKLLICDDTLLEFCRGTSTIKQQNTVMEQLSDGRVIRIGMKNILQFSSDDVCLGAPLSGINIMRYVKHDMYHFKAYVKCLKYKENLKL